jgi:hypothetical protein
MESTVAEADRNHFAIGSGRHGDRGAEIQRERQREPLIVVSMFADQVDATRCKDVVLGCLSELPMQ